MLVVTQVQMAEQRIFLSAMSSEFEAARDALANALQSHDMIVRVQRSFRHDPLAETLLQQLALHRFTPWQAAASLSPLRPLGGVE